MKISTRLATPNSMVLVEDSIGGEIPASLNGSVIAATASCISVGCISEDDGETEITIGYCSSVDTGERPIFEGLLQTPSKQLAVRTVTGVTLLEFTVAMSETNLKIWVNDSIEPDRIAVGII